MTKWKRKDAVRLWGSTFSHKSWKILTTDLFSQTHTSIKKLKKRCTLYIFTQTHKHIYASLKTTSNIPQSKPLHA